MKVKTKKRTYLFLKIIWFTLGGFIFLWTIFWYLQMIHTGYIGSMILFVMGVYSTILFISITLLFISIKFLIKRWKKKKSSGQAK